MPLIECPDCHRQISSEAPTCPGCGRPMKAPDPVPVTPGPSGHMLKATPLEAYGCLYPMIAVVVIIILLALFAS
jgi:hypothetical protein